MYNQGLGSWPARRARISPQRRAIVYGDSAVTYAQLAARVTRLAHGLRSLGTAHGDRVAYLGRNHPAFVETLFAAHALGAVFVPLNARLAPAELDYILDNAGASALIYAPECAETVACLRARAEPRAVVALEGGRDGDLEFEGLVAAGTSEPIDEPVGADEDCMILYTSGTTGRPKGATLTHANVVWNCLNILLDVDVAADEVTLIGAPLFHVAALNQTLLPTILKGACSVIMPAWEAEGCIDLIQRHKVTWMFGVTAMFAGLARSPRWASADLSSLRTLMSGGAPIPESLIRAYQERGLTFLQGYGLTETAPGATFLGAEMSITKAGSAGVPCFFTDVHVVRPDGTAVSAGEPGEVLVSGPNVMRGYWSDPEATEAAFTDGWLHSGDIATIDVDGYLYILDRVKDMYISGGENVYPAEIEKVLASHPAVAECTVVGTADQEWGEVGKAFVIPAAGVQVDERELREFLTARLAKYKVPKHIHFVEALPRTASGKVQKSALRGSEHG